MKTLKAFFRRPETYIGIATALAFQLIFFLVWMTAYNRVDERADQLRIAVVNQDQGVGANITDHVRTNLPFQVTVVESIDKALAEMNERTYDMVMEIPEVFSSRLQTGGQGELKFYINQANASMAKQVVEGVSKQIAQEVNQQVFVMKQQMMSSRLPDTLPPTISEIIANINPTIIQMEIIKTNEAEGFKASMVPMMIVLASFVGAMIMSQQLHLVSNALTSTIRTRLLFLSRQIINLMVSLFISLLTLGLMAIFQIDVKVPFWQAWLFQSLVFLAFLCLSQVFLFMFGNAGMVFNILSLSIQLVTSGVIVPRVMLSSAYQTTGNLFPATYAANGYYTIIFGGTGLWEDSLSLLIIIGVTLLLAIGSAWVKQMLHQKSMIRKRIPQESIG